MTTRRDSIFRSICPFLRHHSVRRFNPFERRETIESWKISLINWNKSTGTLSRLYVNMRALPCVFQKLTSKKCNVKPPTSLLFPLCQRSSRQRGEAWSFHIHINVFLHVIRENIKANTFASDPLFPVRTKKVYGRDAWLLGTSSGKKPTQSIRGYRVLCL